MILISLEEAVATLEKLNKNRQTIEAIKNCKAYNWPTGRWETHKRAVLYKGAKEYVAEIYHECSNCKEEAEIVENGCWLHSKYCPNCGARMEEEE